MSPSPLSFEAAEPTHNETPQDMFNHLSIQQTGDKNFNNPNGHTTPQIATPEPSRNPRQSAGVTPSPKDMTRKSYQGAPPPAVPKGSPVLDRGPSCVLVDDILGRKRAGSGQSRRSELTKMSMTQSFFDELGNPVGQKKYGPRPELSSKQECQLKEAFGNFDPRGAGTIDLRGFTIGMRALSYEPTDDEIDNIILDVLGDSYDNTIDFKDFYSLMKTKMLGEDSVKDVTKAFALFCDESGDITFENLKKIADELGESVPVEEIKEMINFADKKEVKNGRVNLQEFKNILQRPELE